MSARAFAATLLALALTGCGHETEARPGSTEEQEPASDAGLALTSAELESMGLVFAVPEPLEWRPEVRVFGRVVHDPAAITSLTSPVGGRLRSSGPALVLGAELEAGRELFRLEPRWTPQELADLTARRASAAAERAAAEAELPALRQALERARSLHAADQSVSQRELEEAESRLHIAEARVTGARGLEDALAGTARDVPLSLARGGTLVELLAHDGEEVEAGRELVRVEDLRAPLVQLDLPLRGPSLTDAPSARVELEADGASVPAVRVGPAPLPGSGELAAALLFRLQLSRPGPGAVALARPGQSVLAWLPRGGPALRGARVPDSAVVRLAGRAFVYARRLENHFERASIELDQPVPGGWFVSSLDPALELVVRGAQNLLSFELLGRQGAEEED
jgi:hypothetical protein